MPVWAAGETEIALNPGKAQEGGQVQVACEITDGREVTNGKIRIHYDASKLTLTADSAGGARVRGLCEVNDCLTGNKEEGEIVAAFASSSPLTEDGSLLDMTFQLADGVKPAIQRTFRWILRNWQVTAATSVTMRPMQQLSQWKQRARIRTLAERQGSERR